MRAIVRGQPVNWSLLGLALITNLVWMAIASGIYLWVLRTGRQRGTLTRVTAH
jgi:hypothetical protein